ncbi:protein Simiate [Ditylenchus destructor]|nr:protein Simiate [Ditylenchus destructor]
MKSVPTNLLPVYPSVSERNFETYIVEENPGVRYFRHPSGVIVISLDESHEVKTKEVDEIKWEVSQRKGRGVDRSKLELRGKNKNGSLNVFPNTRLCLIHCTDGSEFSIRAGIRGFLVEVNEQQLKENPNLVNIASRSHGYIAIMLPVMDGSRKQNTTESK